MMIIAFIIVGILLLAGIVLAAGILGGLWFGTRAYEDAARGEYVRYDIEPAGPPGERPGPPDRA